MRSFYLYLLIAMVVPTLMFAQQPTNPDTLKKEIDQVKKDLSVLKRLKISGYIQPQFQVADSAGQPSFAGGNFASGVDYRFMIRRGRLKVQYTTPVNEKGISTSTFVLQFDATEKGVVIRDAFAKMTDPWTGYFSITAGMFNDPFGYEIAYSSSLRESPERGRMFQLHFPNEREVGAMLTVQGRKDSKLSWLKWDAGFFNGNGSPSAGFDVSDFDSKKDFITRLSMERTVKEGKITYGGGISYYDGGFRIDSVNVYKSGTDDNGVNGFVIDTRAIENGTVPIADRGFTNRVYYGVDAQFALNWKAGTTKIRGEFITGEQPGSSTSARSPNDRIPVFRDIYSRNFNGAYFYFIHRIMKTPLEVVLKYDWYDPNTDVKSDDIGKAVSGVAKATNATDIRYDTFGFGLLYHFDSSIRVMAYYDMVQNEISKNLSGYTKDLSDNVFTLRVQAKF
jgi:hypothetical protein